MENITKLSGVFYDILTKISIFESYLNVISDSVAKKQNKRSNEITLRLLVYPVYPKVEISEQLIWECKANIHHYNKHPATTVGNLTTITLFDETVYEAYNKVLEFFDEIGYNEKEFTDFNNIYKSVYDTIQDLRKDINFIFCSIEQTRIVI